jgi:hypothetical protein
MSMPLCVNDVYAPCREGGHITDFVSCRCAKTATEDLLDSIFSQFCIGKYKIPVTIRRKMAIIVVNPPFLSS